MESEVRVTVLPPAGREEQLERWGIAPDRTGDLRRGQRLGHGAEDSHYESGFSLEDDVDLEHDGEALGFLLDGGWTAVETHRGSQGWTPGARDAGMTAHRGVIQPEEYVDDDVLREAVESELGFSAADVHAVYRQGKKSAPQLALRMRVDARLLELAQAGANLTLLGRALGFPVKPNGNVRALENALARARKEHA